MIAERMLPRRALAFAFSPFFGALAITTASLARAEPPAPTDSPIAVPSDTPAAVAPPEPARPAPTTMPRDPEPRPTVPAPPRPPPIELSHPAVQPPSTVAEYDRTRGILKALVAQTQGRESALYAADLAKVDRWYEEDVYVSWGSLAAGITFAVAAPVLLVGAVAAGKVDSLSFDIPLFGSPSYSSPPPRRRSGNEGVAAALGVGAVASLLVGIPLTVYGARRHMRTPDEREAWKEAHPQSASAASLGLTLGPGTLTVGGAF